MRALTSFLNPQCEVSVRDKSSRIQLPATRFGSANHAGGLVVTLWKLKLRCTIDQQRLIGLFRVIANCND